MKRILNDITGFIGNTPVIELRHLTGSRGGHVLAKMEYIQPGGSIKDRAALQIITDAYAQGKLQKSQPVVEMTSGNMGAGLAVVCGAMGNPFIATMSEGNSPERIKILEALGAEVVLVPQADGMPGKVTGKDIAAAVSEAKRIKKQQGAIYVDQFNNPSSVLAHYNTTGPEIWQQLEGEIDGFVASIGTGGTFVGVSRFIKEQNSRVFCAASEPQNAAIIKTGHMKNPRHIIQGTGYGLVPPHWDPGLADDIILVTDKEVERTTRALAEDEGLYVGYSSGANVCAALKLLESDRFKDKENPLVVTVLCDTAYKYSAL